jgi:hypothetical protein
MDDVLRALIAGAAELRGKTLSPAAPPAFLLDARRHGLGAIALAGMFDNRSIAFPTDFPSAARLRGGDIQAVVLIQNGSNRLRPDVGHTLAAWQKDGLPAFLLRADAPEVATPLVVRGPGILDRVSFWWRRATLRRDEHGAFGTRIPQAG